LIDNFQKQNIGLIIILLTLQRKC